MTPGVRSDGASRSWTQAGPTLGVASEAILPLDAVLILVLELELRLVAEDQGPLAAWTRVSVEETVQRRGW